MSKTAAEQHFIHVVFCQNIRNENKTQTQPSALAEVFDGPRAFQLRNDISLGDPFENITSIPDKMMASIEAKITINYY